MMSNTISPRPVVAVQDESDRSSISIDAELAHSLETLKFGSGSLETHIGSVLILTEDNLVLHASKSLQNRLQELVNQGDTGSRLPHEIALICQVLRQSRECFPNQNWAIEFDIFTKDAIALRIRSRWLKLDGFDKPCILLILEDPQQLIQDMVLDEAQDWGLTPREQEVWLLHRDGHTYCQIATKLFITINTVKKHMRSIHAKRKAQLGEDLDCN